MSAFVAEILCLVLIILVGIAVSVAAGSFIEWTERQEKKRKDAKYIEQEKLQNADETSQNILPPEKL